MPQQRDVFQRTVRIQYGKYYGKDSYMPRQTQRAETCRAGEASV